MPTAPRWVWFPLEATARFILRNGRRLVVTVVGFALLLAGLALLVLPGPGVLLILGGLVLLATEYVWAQRALNYARRQASRAKSRAAGATRRRQGG